MNPTVTGRPSRCASRRAVSKHSRTARGSFDPAAASTTASSSSRPSSSRRRGQHRDDAIVGAEFVGELGSAADAIEPQREPGAHVEPRGEHERHDDGLGLRGGSQRASPRHRRFDASTKLMETSRSGRSDATPSTSRITASRFSVEAAPWVTATSRSGWLSEPFAGSPAPLDPTIFATPRFPAGSGLSRRFRRYARRVSRTHPRVSGR